MQIQIVVNEYDLMDIAVGDTVYLTFTFDDLGLSEGLGTVQMISDVSTSTDTSDVSYAVYIDFEAKDDTRLGMTVMVDLMGEEELMELETETEETEAARTDTAPATEEAPALEGDMPVPGGDDFTNMPSP